MLHKASRLSGSGSSFAHSIKSSALVSSNSSLVHVVFLWADFQSESISNQSLQIITFLIARRHLAKLNPLLDLLARPDLNYSVSNEWVRRTGCLDRTHALIVSICHHVRHLPSCSNNFPTIPDRSYEQLAEKLNSAIDMTEGFGNE